MKGKNLKKFNGVKRNYTWYCPNCGAAKHDCYDDPSYCSSCGWSRWG